MIKEKQTRFKMRRPWLIYLGLAILSIPITSQITGVGEDDPTDLQYCLKSDILTCLPSVSRWSRRTKHKMTNQVQVELTSHYMSKVTSKYFTRLADGWCER